MQRRTFLAVATAAVIAAGAGALPVRAEDPETLKVALLPDENASTIIQNAQPLKDYLEQALGKDVELVVTTDYSSMIEAMRFNRIDVGYFGPLSYVLAKSKAAAIEPFAVGVKGGSPTYQSVVIANPAGPVKTIADIRGQTFGFGDPASTSSHLIPRALLAGKGLNAGTDYEFAHLGTHDSVARAVQAGQVQAGGMSEEIYRKLVERGTIDPAKVVVLEQSKPIPNYPIVMQGELSPELKAQIRAAFLEMKDPAILKSFRAEGFAATDDQAYDVLRETAQILNLDLAKMN